MEMANEILLNTTVYCFENAERVAQAKAWIETHPGDAARFRVAFPDARPVSTRPLGSDRRDP